MGATSMTIEDGSDFKSDSRKSKKTIQILAAIIAVLLILVVTFISLYASEKSSSDDDSSSASKGSVKNPSNLVTTTMKMTTGGQVFTQSTEEPTAEYETSTSMNMTNVNGTTGTTSTKVTDAEGTTGTTSTKVTDAEGTTGTTSTKVTTAEGTAGTTSTKVTTAEGTAGTKKPATTPMPKLEAIANEMKGLMNLTANPCEDFSLYACGNFYKTATIPDDRVRTGPYVNAIDKNMELFKELLEGSAQTNGTFEGKMKKLYKACMDEDAIEMYGLKDYTVEFKSNWPTLNSDWDVASFNLQAATNDALTRFNEVLFTLQKRIVHGDDGNAVAILEIRDPYMILDKATLTGDRNSKKIMALQKYYTDFSVALGAEETSAAADAKQVVDAISDLAKLFLDPADARSISKVNNPTTFAEMNVEYTYLNWTEAIQSMFDVDKKKILPDNQINIFSKNYIENLGDFLNRTDHRVIQNIFGFKQALALVSEATKEMRNISLDFLRVTWGIKKESPRNEQCATVVNSIYNYGMGKLVSNKMFSQEAVKFMDTMIVNLKNAFRNDMQSSTWMNENTKLSAVQKLDDMTTKIGIPTKNFEIKDLDEKYKDYMVGGDFNKDILQNKKLQSEDNWAVLNEVVDKSKWTLSMTIVNAFNKPDENEIVFPLGILQPPFFDQDRPSYMNYAGIGDVIGHEIGHGFDSAGRYFDNRGKITDWWTSEDVEQYEKKTQCFTEQYSGFEVNVNNTMYKLNGALTKTENVPDTLGMLYAYKAYKMYQNETNDAKDVPLLGLDLTIDQLFFLSFAQGWCQKTKPEFIKTSLAISPHSDPKFRIIGTLQNHPEFAKVYGCGRDSYMNPVKKCSIW